MVNPLFRQTALDQASSPDQLDQLLRITNPRAWLGLLGLGAVVIAVLFWAFGGSIPLQASGSGILSRSDAGLYGVQAPGLGTVSDVPVHIGDHLTAGQRLMTLSAADGTQTVITTPQQGRLLSLFVEPGSVVSPGQKIGVVDPESIPLEALVFIPAEQAASVQPGMQVRLQPNTVPSERYGDLLGTVKSVEKYPASPQRIAFVLQNDTLASSISRGGALFEVHVAVTPDSSSPDGYKWSSGRGPDVAITGGTVTTASVVLAQQAPRTLAFPESNR